MCTYRSRRRCQATGRRHVVQHVRMLRRCVHLVDDGGPQRSRCRRRGADVVLSFGESAGGRREGGDDGVGCGATGAEIESVDAGAQMLSVHPGAVHGEHARAILARFRFAGDRANVPPERRNCSNEVFNETVNNKMRIRYLDDEKEDNR